MVVIRLRRTGAKKQPSYRVVVTDSHAPRDGKFIEIIGHYNPRTEPPTMEIDAERAIYWLGTGAQPSEAVGRILDKMGIMAQMSAIRRGEVSAEQFVSQLAPAPEEKARKRKAEPVEAAFEQGLGEDAELEEEAEFGDDEEPEEADLGEGPELEEEEEAWDEAELGEAEDEEEVGSIEDEEYDDEWDEDSEDVADDDE
jgi:small subunit ribosomal protein S16